MKKIFYITTLLTIIIISYLGITYSFEYNSDDTINFEIIGPSTLYMNVNTDYKEYGVNVTFNDLDISNKLKIDTSDLDTSKLGEYLVKYQVSDEYIYRKVIVIDNTAPVITLNGGEEIYLSTNSEYQEYGYEVKDNYDKLKNEDVRVTNNVDTHKEGIYKVEYTVTDKSGNVGTKVRQVIVKSSLVDLNSTSGNLYSLNNYNVTSYSNSITKNKFTEKGIYVEGYSKDNSNSYKIKLKNRENVIEYEYVMNKVRNNYYFGDIDLSNVYNGIYDVYLLNNSEERVLNKLDILSRIVRSRIGNKLITFIYDNDYVSIDVSDFKYEYDIVIDPGHGGYDIGTAHDNIAEKTVNLMISKYEKCRYESMGYKVYLLRSTDTYGEVLGPSILNDLERKALAIGYYGSVSKITYSNHHNGSYNYNERAFEILVLNQSTKEELSEENNIYNRYLNYYGLTEDKIRMYSKNYDTDEMYNKSHGEVYDITNYYAVIRIPYELFNIKNTIYEPIYMTNNADFDWYYNGKHYIDVSEIKIEEYVKSLGGTYIKDNSKCL